MHTLRTKQVQYYWAFQPVCFDLNLCVTDYMDKSGENNYELSLTLKSDDSQFNVNNRQKWIWLRVLEGSTHTNQIVSLNAMLLYCLPTVHFQQF